MSMSYQIFLNTGVRPDLPRTVAEYAIYWAIARTYKYMAPAPNDQRFSLENIEKNLSRWLVRLVIKVCYLFRFSIFKRRDRKTKNATTKHMKRETCKHANMQHATCNMQHATTCTMKHTTLKKKTNKISPVLASDGAVPGGPSCATQGAEEGGPKFGVDPGQAGRAKRALLPSIQTARPPR